MNELDNSLYEGDSGVKVPAVRHGYVDAYVPANVAGKGLSDKHRAILENESGIAPEVIEARGYYTETDKNELKKLGYSDQQALTPALVIPTRSPDGTRESFVIRHDIPRTDRKGKAIKYDVPRNSSHIVDVNPICLETIGDPSVPIFVTEGAKKEDSVISHVEGACAISINGVDANRGKNARGGITALTCWDCIAFNGRTVVVAFDSDVARKPSVRSALERITTFFQGRGARVKVLYLEDGPRGEKTGLDDFFARGGTESEMWRLCRDLEPTAERKNREREENKQRIQDELNQDGRPIIEVRGVQSIYLLEAIEKAVACENEKRPYVFRGISGEKCHLARNSTGEMVIQPFNSASMAAHVSRVARFVATSDRGDVSHAPVPRSATDMYLEGGFNVGIGDLTKVVETPFITSDGELVAQAGYCAEEKCYLDLPDDFDMGDTEPTESNVIRARELILDEILPEIAFDSEASRANAIALMLLPFVRNLIKGPTPLNVIDAPGQASGKTYAMQVLVAPFKKPSIKAECRNEEEIRKYLGAKALSGSSHVCFDNVVGGLSEGTLAATITSGRFEDRLMGSQKLIEVPFGPVWVATSNNAQLSGDAASRCVIIRLDPRMERPEERKFAKNPLRFIEENRPRVVGAIITLVRNWIEKGRPAYSGPNSCRFGEWLEVMGGILQCAGINGILDNQKAIALAMDPEREAWNQLVLAWNEAHGERPVKAKDLVEIASQIDFFAAKMGDYSTEAVKGQKLGIALAKAKDRIFEGLVIEKTTDRDKISRFRISSITA